MRRLTYEISTHREKPGFRVIWKVGSVSLQVIDTVEYKGGYNGHIVIAINKQHWTFPHAAQRYVCLDLDGLYILKGEVHPLFI